jgi:dissimilatory sulfite reductase (desulfoviridin) alpha/beta subunit
MDTMANKDVDYAALKKGGFMKQVQKDRFSLRLRVVGGQLSSAQLEAIGKLATRFGKGYVHMTSRQGVEIPFVPLDAIDEIKAELAKADLQPGACGPRLRTITACQGNTICPSGLIETSDLARELDARYFGRQMPHKFKIGITGCTNNCLKAEENDIGIKGALYPEWVQKACSFCGLCEAVCPEKSIKVNEATKTINFDEKSCVYCGKCVKSCPEDAWKGKNGYKISFGGMFGNEIKTGVNLTALIFDKDTVFKVIDAAIDYYTENGKAGERFGKLLSKLGVEKLQEKLAAIL